MKRIIASDGLEGTARQIHIPAHAKLSDLEVVGGTIRLSGKEEFLFRFFLPSMSLWKGLLRISSR